MGHKSAKIPKTKFFCLPLFIATFNLEIISIKSVLTSDITFINPYNTLFGLKFLKKLPAILLYWFAAHQQSKSTHKRQ